MFVVARETVIDGDFTDYNIIGCFTDMKNAKKFVRKCIEADITEAVCCDEETCYIYDFRSIPRCYRYVIREVKLNETICD
jgi:hypothetical protein